MMRYFTDNNMYTYKTVKFMSFPPGEYSGDGSPRTTDIFFVGLEARHLTNHHVILCLTKDGAYCKKAGGTSYPILIPLGSMLTEKMITYIKPSADSNKDE